MALTGLQIFKYLPGGKKEKEANCKKCGFPTCMAFAMKLAKGESGMEKCEYISDELKTVLNEANRVQQREITFGPAQNQAKTGNETVMFRHEKKFVNPTCIAVKLDSSDLDFDRKLDEISEYSVERVGETFKIDAVALFDTDEKFIQNAQKINSKNIPLILVSSSAENIEKTLEQTATHKPVLCIPNIETEKLVEIGKRFDVPVIISCDTVEELVQEADKALKLDFDNVILSLNNITKNNPVENLTRIRKAAIEDKFPPLGFPVASFVKSSGNVFEDAVTASVLLCKYSNIIVLDSLNKALISSLSVLKQNLFIDPQKPLQVEPNVYAIGEVGRDSPVVVTTNFALTYFSVMSEIEASGVSAYLLITPSDGMSVLTAWAAGKFTGETIAKAVKQHNLDNLVNHKKIIIPGYVESLKSEILEELPEWEVVAGPNEAFEIVDFLKRGVYI